jgi:hypothetical protein
MVTNVRGKYFVSFCYYVSLSCHFHATILTQRHALIKYSLTSILRIQRKALSPSVCASDEWSGWDVEGKTRLFERHIKSCELLGKI